MYLFTLQVWIGLTGSMVDEVADRDVRFYALNADLSTSPPSSPMSSSASSFSSSRSYSSTTSSPSPSRSDSYSERSANGNADQKTQLVQIPLIAIGRIPSIKRNKLLGNTVFWLGLYAGFPLLCVAYCAY